MDEKLPDGWVWTTLGEIRFDLAKGIVPGNFPMQFFELYSVPSFDSEKPEILQGKDIKSNKQLVDSNTVLLCKINPRINRAWVVGNFSEYQKIASTEWIPFFNVPMISPAYLSYYLRQNSIRDYFAANASGVGGSLMRINDKIVADYPFPLAPFPEQSRIVAAIEQQFTRLDSAVASLQSAKARVKQYRASLLKSAVEGELTKEWRVEHPVEETGEQLLRRILVERRARWEEAELAKMKEKPRDDKWKQKYKEPQEPNVENLPTLPERWCWATFEQTSQRVTVGYVGSMAHEYIDSGVPFLRSQNVRPNRFDPAGLKYISPEFHRKLEKSALESGDILVVRSGSVGVACVMPSLYEQANCSDLVIVKRPVINPNYAAYYMNSTAHQRVISQQVGIALNHFNTQSMATFPLPLPPLSEQEQIVAEVEAKLSNIEQLEATIVADLKRAEHERQSILQEAFAGRLVLQDMNDEPASVLLERIREERKKREEAEKIVKASRKGDHVGSAKRPRVGRVASSKRTIGLYEKLVEAGQPLAPDDLFKQVGLKADDQPESVETFYEELHADVVTGLIEEGRPSADKVLLYAVEHDNEDLEEVEVLREDGTVPVVEEMQKVREEENRRSLWDA